MKLATTLYDVAEEPRLPDPFVTLFPVLPLLISSLQGWWSVWIDWARSWWYGYRGFYTSSRYDCSAVGLMFNRDAFFVRLWWTTTNVPRLNFVTLLWWFVTLGQAHVLCRRRSSIRDHIFVLRTYNLHLMSLKAYHLLSLKVVEPVTNRFTARLGISSTVWCSPYG